MVKLPRNFRKREAIDSSSMEASGGAGDARDERPRPAARDTPPPVTNGGVRDEEGGAGEGDGEGDGDALPTDMSDTSDSEPDKPHNGGAAEACTSSHTGKLLLRKQFPFNIDQMFTMIFTNSKFNLELLAARGTTDYVQAPWQPQNGLKCRQISYTLGLTSGPIGPKEVHVTEVQVMNKCSKAGALYSIDATSENAGIPYADYFSVEVHYCLRRAADHTELALYAHVKYKKTMWPMIKAFLEKNTLSGLEEYARLLEAQLAAEARPAPSAARARRRRRHDVCAVPALVAAPAGVPAAGGAPRAPTAPARLGGALVPLLLLLLVLLNALLCWRLYVVDTRSTVDLDHLHNRMSAATGGAAAQWAAQLERHARRQRGQLAGWRAALHDTVAHLAQTERALSKLLETIKPVLERSEGRGEGQGEEEAPRDEL